jgi:glycosyltransferase involved in cell wall biosynthesis
MPKAFHFVDLSVHNRHFKSIRQEQDQTKHSLGYLEFMDDAINIAVIRFGDATVCDGDFHLFNRFLSASFFRLLSAKKNAVVLFHGFSFPFHFWLLRLLYPKMRWLVQHHAGNPSPNPFKRLIQKIAYSRADAYLFVSKAQANPFIAAGIISSEHQVSEIMECSTGFTPQNTTECRAQLNVAASKVVFIWVGNLNANKDPMCALEAIKKLRDSGHDFEFYLFYGTSELLGNVSNFITHNKLENYVFLKGRIANQSLESWYSAADFFISCSHSEGSGVAMAEAMACGCVPIVTSIPSFVTMTANGEAGLLFEPGNSENLFHQLTAAMDINIAEHRVKSHKIFKERLSFEAIGTQTSQLARVLQGK